VHNRADKVLNNLRRLKGDRGPWEDLFQDITTYLDPRGGDFWRTRQKGDGRFEDIYDATAVQARNLAASALFSRVTNPASRWFFLRVNDREAMDDGENLRWFEDTRDVTQATINRQLANHTHQTFKQILGYGTGVLFIDEDEKTDVAGQVFGLARVWIDQDFGGNINAVYREFQLNAGNALKMFPEGLSDNVRQMATQKPEAMIDFVHVVQPRDSFDPDKVDILNMPIESLWLEVTSKSFVKEGGFPEFPYIVPRLDVLAGEIYGRSPGMEALPDILTLNSMVRLELDGANMSIRPAMDIPDEAYVTPFDLTPGAKNYNQDPTGRKATPITSTGDFNIAAQSKAELRASIRKAFFNDQLRLASGKQMTATEVLETQNSNNQLMGPWQTRLEKEFLEPMINRVFNILMRRGKFLEPPAKLKKLLEEGDGEIVITYDSPLARAQKLQDVRAIDDTFLHIGQLVGAGFPVQDNYELDKMSRSRSSLSGLPLEFVKEETEVEADRAAADAELEAARQQQELQQAVETGATAAQALPEEEAA